MAESPPLSLYKIVVFPASFSPAIYKKEIRRKVDDHVFTASSSSYQYLDIWHRLVALKRQYKVDQASRAYIDIT